MLKYIIYGKGRFFLNKVGLIPWKQVVAVADKQAKAGEYFHAVPVILPQEMDTYEYDLIVIFSRQLFEQISQELQGMYFVPQDKIVSWRIFEEADDTVLSDGLSFFSRFIEEYRVRNVLDTNIEVLSDNIYSKGEISKTENFVLEGIGEYKFPIVKHLYDRLYSSFNECVDKYDLLVFWNINETFKKKGSRILSRTKYILVFIRYDRIKEITAKDIKLLLQEYGKVSLFPTTDGFWFLVDRLPENEKLENAQIYVVTHKKYNLIKNELYMPICVGDLYHNDEFLSEHQGENISYLNEKINECTALYWIWKNTASEYVGLCHYRRYFYNNEMRSMDNVLDEAHLAEYMKDYDILLAESEKYNCSVKEQLCTSIDNEEAYKQGEDIILDLITRRQPEYLAAYEDVMNRTKFFHCNMFVTRREIFDAYCEWLFSFLIEAAEKADISGYDNYSKRVIGFFAERMWTVWLMNQNLKIKELPITKWEA